MKSPQLKKVKEIRAGERKTEKEIRTDGGKNTGKDGKEKKF